MDNVLFRLRANPREMERWHKAQQDLLSGEMRAALTVYQGLVQRYPKVAQLWFELGNAASGELDFRLANTAYRRALELQPQNASLLGMIGQQYQALRQLDDARACFERAVAADPASVDAQINLAVWFEKERRLDDAWACIEACLARHPQDDQARYFRALLMHRQGKPEEAETALRDLIKATPSYPYVRYAAPHLLAVVLDQLGQYEEAMHWLCEAKAQVRKITDTSVLEQAYDQTERHRRDSLASLTGEILKRWRQEPPATSESYQLAFLGGHPRSGTTLLEQILGAHPEVQAFDESTAFSQEIAERIAPDREPGLERLDRLPAARRAQMRQRYIKSLLREAPGLPNARVLLDKNPSPTASLHVWLRVFPELKVLIALRDPRDVVISCFFLNIMLNATNVNFLSLERTAKHYADLMDVWLRLRELGGFDWLEIRYESIVENLEMEGKRVTEFLGLTWHGDQAQYFEKSRRKFLYAPTYHDVAQPVYRRAVGRWERYTQALEPIQSRLLPYCRALGYG